MNRAFTTREKVLLIILVVLLVGCFYYLAVLKPSLDTLSSSEARVAAAQSEIMVQQAIATQKAQLEQQIAETEAAGASIKTLPAYDNTKNEITELNTILSQASSYNINFADADTSGTLVRRTVSISYTSASYADAQAVLGKLINCKYSCLVTDITMSGENLGQSSASGDVKASVTVIFFEKK